MRVYAGRRSKGLSVVVVEIVGVPLIFETVYSITQWSILFNVLARTDHY